MFARPQKDTHWISESGIIDVFFLTGDVPHDIFPKVLSSYSTALEQCACVYRVNVLVLHSA
jgi:hypothetical protein